MRSVQRAVLAGCALAAALALPAAAVTVAVNPALPTYGEKVTVELHDTPYATYLPATRYSVQGSTIVVDFEYAPGTFGPARPDFGRGAITLGELVPGNYTVQARLFDMSNPKTPPQSTSRNIAVVPPQEWGLYAIPRHPDAFAPWDVLVRSAVYFDPSSLQVRIDGSVIRIDFDYDGSAPAGGSAPPGMTTFAAAKITTLQPGTYRVEGWGREIRSRVSERYFTREVTVGSAVPVVEYYSPSLDHYFMTADPAEIALVDRGGRGDWQRTGFRFKAWARPSDASPFARPVCRFYSRQANSHFYAGDPRECEFLKGLEQRERSEAAARGETFGGWAYEGIAFHAVVPEYGACPGGMVTVYRAYNGRAADGDPNHRFTVDATQRTAMSLSWIDEGAAFCSPI